jgi:predicted permease
MSDLIRDLRQTLRSLGRTPLFTTVALVTLAVGIGVNATIFTFVDSILLRPLPVAEPDELVHVYTRLGDEPYATSSWPDFVDLRESVEAFRGPDGSRAGLIGHASAIATLQHDGRSEVRIGELVTGDAFRVLGVPAARGRTILPEDDEPGAARVVVLADGLWRSRFGGDPEVLGESVRLNGDLYRVVGIAPASFPGLLPGVAADYWLPTVRVGDVEPAGQIHGVTGDPGTTRLERRGYRWLWLKGRLAPGVTRAEAEAQAATVMARLAAEHPITNVSSSGERGPVGATVADLGDVRFHPDVDRVVGPAAAILLGAVGLVLLVVCANLANMLLSRAQGRRREIAVRLALGVSRRRLTGQLLTESLVLGLGGALLATLLTFWATELLLAWQPPLPFSIGLDIGVSLRVLLYIAGVAVLSAIVFGLAPARQAGRHDLVTDLKGGDGGGGRSRRLSLKNGLVVAQVAVSTVFLVAAALLGRGLLASSAIDVGFEPERVAAVGLDLGMYGYEDEEAAAFWRTLTERTEALPGVESAAVATRVPFDVNLHWESIYPDTVEGNKRAEPLTLDATWTDPGYFRTLGVPVLRGRTFHPADTPDSPRVAVINATLAERFWGDAGSAVGRSFRVGSLDSKPVEIVGVVADYKIRTVGEEPRLVVHYARGQAPGSYGYLLARSAQPDAAGALAAVGEIRRIALEMEPDLAFDDTTTLGGFMGISLYPVRMGATLLGAFGVLALALSSLGLYGVIAYSVARRRREMGVRFALGARPKEVVGLVLRDGMALVATGLGVGLVLAALAARLLTGVLYGTSALDPVAYGLATAVLVVIALAANAVPAARAAKVDPVTALRQE